MSFSLLMKYFKKTEKENKKCNKPIIWRNYLRNFVGRCKHLRKKRKDQGFIVEIKMFQPQTSMHLPTLLQFPPEEDQQHKNTTTQYTGQICTS